VLSSPALCGHALCPHTLCCLNPCGASLTSSSPSKPFVCVAAIHCANALLNTIEQCHCSPTHGCFLAGPLDDRTFSAHTPAPHLISEPVCITNLIVFLHCVAAHAPAGLLTCRPAPACQDTALLLQLNTTWQQLQQQAAPGAALLVPLHAKYPQPYAAGYQGWRWSMTGVQNAEGRHRIFCICSVVCVPTVMSTAIRQHMLFCIVDFIAACVATLHPPCEREPGRKGHNTSHNRQAGVLRFLPHALPVVTIPLSCQCRSTLG
jgi:hypothetical protein